MAMVLRVANPTGRLEEQEGQRGKDGQIESIVGDGTKFLPQNKTYIDRWVVSRTSSLSPETRAERA